MSETPFLDKILALAGSSEVRGYERVEHGREEFVHGFSRAGFKSFRDLAPGDYVHMPDNRVYRVMGAPALLGTGTRALGRRVRVSLTHDLLGRHLEHVRSGQVMQAAALSYEPVRTVQPRAGVHRVLPGLTEDMTPPDPSQYKFILGAPTREAESVAEEMDRRLG